ncbi:sodium:proton antiporter [Haloferula sp.]|uniref:sodium:proton antiporter n=1 Tax=Haloferula sp. TaxID=2497595 RepID=UPI003C788952
MELLIAITIGLLIAAGLYRVAGPSRIDTVIGLLLLSQGANLTIFASGGLRHNAAALIEGEQLDVSAFTDPLPQALVLTAIVIGFGILAFLLTLILRSPSK